MNFALVLRIPKPERFWGAQDGTQNGPRSAPDGPKRLSMLNFFGLEHRLNFGLVCGPILDDFGAPKGTPLPRKVLQMRIWKLVFFVHVIMVAFWFAFKTAQEAPRSLPDPPMSAPRASKRLPRPSPEAPRRPQETPRAGQEGSRASKITPRCSRRN